MRRLVNYLFYIIIVVLLSANIYMQVARPQSPNTNLDVEQRVKTIEEKYCDLQVELEDVKNVQGYIVWETDWRNKNKKSGI